MFKTEILV